MPSRAPQSLMDEAQHAAVDDREEWQVFSRPLDAGGGEWESRVAIEGMHCAACSITIEQALCAVPGVRSASVNAASHLARVVWAPGQTQPSRWMDAVARAGYRALPAGDLFNSDARRAAWRMALWRWLVAGFCMMQVMMYALPAYVAGPGELTDNMAQLLRWASWVLTLPVLLFSCWPFFQSALRDLRQRRVGMDVPVALGIAIAFVASTVATFEPAGLLGAEVWYDSLTMFVFFLLSGRLLELRLRDRTAGAIESLSRQLPASVERRDADGRYTRVAARRLAAGDVIRLRPGEVFPADGRIIEGQTQVDEALLTGESRPLARGPGSAVIAGSHNLSGLVVVRVERTGAQTRYASIVALMEEAALDKPRLAQLADRIATPFLVGVLLASAGAALWWWPTDPNHAISVAIAVLIVTCPCALSLATPAATLAAAGALARRGVLVRRLQALETCTRIDTVVFDKTGTLTQDRMALGRVVTREGVSAQTALRLAAALARHSLHPASRALSVAAQTLDLPAAIDVRELSGQGVLGWVTDATAELPLRELRLGSARFCSAPARARPDEVLQVHLADASGWLASFDLDEDLRTDALPAVQALQAMGLRVQVLSGDHAQAVARLARRAGIEDARGDQSPADKLAVVEALQAQGHRVMMVGDGVNDGPVLARAHVSVALGDAAPLAQICDNARSR